MSNNTSSKKRHRSFMVGFSFVDKPEGIDNIEFDGGPSPDMMHMAEYLTDLQPMLSFVFNTPDDQPPTIDEVYSCIREAYTATSSDPDLNEAYGLFLDAMKIVKSQSMKFGRSKMPVIPKEIEDLIPPELKGSLNKFIGTLEKLLSTKGHSNVFSVDGKIVCLKMHCITSFDIGKPE